MENLFRTFRLLLNNTTTDFIRYLTIKFHGTAVWYAYSGGYPFSISGDIRSVPS